MRILGIDPSQRHTGLALYTGGSVVFREIKPIEVDVLSSVLRLKESLRTYLKEIPQVQELVVSMEKQVLSGHSSTLLFYVEMAVAEVLHEVGVRKMVSPLPIQLKSFMKKVEGVGIASKTEIVASFRARYGEEYGVSRISSHCVEAFYLVKLAKAVLEGSWGYKLPASEVPLYPWSVIGGKVGD